MAISLTSTAIANRALQIIGHQARLTSLETDTSTVAGIVRLIYDDAVEAVLQGSEWNFNAGRAELAEHGSQPVFGFTRQYVLPSDCLGIREIHTGGRFVYNSNGMPVYYADDGRADEWRVEVIGNDEASFTNVLVCNFTSPVHVVYSRRMTVLSRWSPLAREALAGYIAMQVAMPVTQNSQMFEMARQVYEQAIGSAVQRDAQEGSATFLHEGRAVQARW